MTNAEMIIWGEAEAALYKAFMNVADPADRKDLMQQTLTKIEKWLESARALDYSSQPGVYKIF
jgi:hypothetical protein